MTIKKHLNCVVGQWTPCQGKDIMADLPDQPKINESANTHINF